jgi:ribonuclease Z
MINITLLGTSCMVPTKERNVTAIYLEYDGEGILFDCGEGTQRQMNIANLNRNKIGKILISHWHGDHVSGILGLIQTIGNNLGASEEKPSLEIFGPKETRERFQLLLRSTYFENKITYKITELPIDKLTRFYENDSYYLEAIPLDHNIPTLGYNFIEKDRLRIKVSVTHQLGIPEGPLLGKLQAGHDITFKGKNYSHKDLTYTVKGKKVSIVMDTSYTKNIIELSQDADLMISEATYLDKHMEKGEKHKHLTVKQAAMLAHAANAKKLVMMHFSQRYSDFSELESEAKDIFPESSIGYDFMKLKL